MFSDYIQTYCFAHGTYVHRSLKKGLVGVEAAAPGVGPGNAYNRADVRKIISYFWLPYLFLAQAMLAYLPRVLLKFIEGINKGQYYM